MHFWLYYILFIIITITFSYILTTKIMAPVSASAHSATGHRTPMHNIGAIMADALLKDTLVRIQVFEDAYDYLVNC